MFYIAIATMMRTEAERPESVRTARRDQRHGPVHEGRRSIQKLRLYQPPCQSKARNAAMPAHDEMSPREMTRGRLIHFRYVPAPCQSWPVRGKKRCRLHGGRSTGPITPDGLARTLAGMRAGRTRWLARLKSEGEPIPCGRKKGGRNLPAEEREQVAYEKQCRRQAREVLRQIRAERKARRV